MQNRGEDKRSGRKRLAFFFFLILFLGSILGLKHAGHVSSLSSTLANFPRFFLTPATSLANTKKVKRQSPFLCVFFFRLLSKQTTVTSQDRGSTLCLNDDSKERNALANRLQLLPTEKGPM